MLLLKSFTLLLSSDINLNIYAENPFSGKMVPLLVSSFVQFEENVEMHVGIPSSSPDDLAFAERHQLHFENVLEKKESGQNLGFLVNSGKVLHSPIWARGAGGWCGKWKVAGGCCGRDFCLAISSTHYIVVPQKPLTINGC